MALFGPGKMQMVTAALALPGRDQPMPVPDRHRVLGNRLMPPFADGVHCALFGMGCFWGAERRFWGVSGVWSTAVGYGGGFTSNPLYDEVCSGRTGHAELVLVAYDPRQVGYDTLLAVFWQSHDPTQGMRQGNDLGTQYRSALYCFDDTQRHLAHQSAALYQQALTARGYGSITTEIADAPAFYYAEPYHQQYLDANPGGYCGLAGTGVLYR